MDTQTIRLNEHPKHILIMDKHFSHSILRCCFFVVVFLFNLNEFFGVGAGLGLSPSSEFQSFRSKLIILQKLSEGDITRH